MSIPAAQGKTMCGGMEMDSQTLWQLFLETGAPEMYLLFNKARQMEDVHVLDDTGIGAARHQLQ